MCPTELKSDESITKNINHYVKRNKDKLKSQETFIEFIKQTIVPLHSSYQLEQRSDVTEYCDCLFEISDLLFETMLIDVVNVDYYNGLIDKLLAFKQRRPDEFDLPTIRHFCEKSAAILLSAIDYFECTNPTFLCYSKYVENRSIYIEHLKECCSILDLTTTNLNSFFAAFSEFYRKESQNAPISQLQQFYLSRANRFEALRNNHNQLLSLLTTHCTEQATIDMKKNDGIIAHLRDGLRQRIQPKPEQEKHALLRKEQRAIEAK